MRCGAVRRRYSAYQTFGVVQVGRTIATTSTAAYSIAEKGGKHSGYLRNMAGRPVQEIANAVKGHEKTIQKHIGYLKNPTSKVPMAEWLAKTEAEKQVVRQKWLDDIARNRELRDVMQGLLERLVGR